MSSILNRTKLLPLFFFDTYKRLIVDGHDLSAESRRYTGTLIYNGDLGRLREIYLKGYEIESFEKSLLLIRILRKFSSFFFLHLRTKFHKRLHQAHDCRSLLAAEAILSVPRGNSPSIRLCCDIQSSRRVTQSSLSFVYPRLYILTSPTTRSIYLQHIAMDFNGSNPFPEGVISFLDTDLYKLTMQNAVLKWFPEVQVTYAFKNRTPEKKLSRAAFSWLQEQINSGPSHSLA